MLPLFKELLQDAKIREELEKKPRNFQFPKGANILVGVSQWRPHVEVVKTGGDDGHDGGIFLRGPIADLLNSIAKSINFTYTLIEPPDGAWGSMLPNGTWTGMVGQVTRKEVDIALGPFGQTESRSKVVDFTQPIGYSTKRLIVAKNRPEINPWGFLFPLSPTVWGALMMTLVGAWLSMMVMDLCYSRKYGINWAFKILFNHFSVLLQQHMCIPLERIWRRMVVCSWLIVATVVTWSYSGNLMSQLAVRYVPQSVRTVQDMVDNSRLTLIQLNNTALTDYLARVKSGVFREVALMWDEGRMRYLPSREFPHALNTLVRQGDHVLLTTSLTADLYMADLYTRTGQCDFYKAQEEFLPLALGLISQKGSPLMPAINARIGYALAAGLYDHWLMTSIDNSSACLYSPSKITVQESLALSNIWGMYVILATGILVSLMAFVIEVISGLILQ